MQTDFFRRQFIKAALATAAGAVLSPQTLGAGLVAQARPAAKPVNAFAKCLQFLDYDRLGEALAHIGFDGADLPVRPGGTVLPEKVKTDLPRVLKALQKQGRTIPMIVTAINDPNHPHTEQILGTASQLGIQYYRMGYFGYDKTKSVPQNLDLHKKTMEKLEQINRKYNIHGGYQNHSGTGVGAPVWDLYWLLQDRDPAYIGLQYDICHGVTEGGVSWPLALKLLAPWIKTAAIKDFMWARDNNKQWKIKYVPLGEGMVDFHAYLAQYKALGLTGPITIHFEYDLGGAEHGNANPTMPLADLSGYLKKDLAWLRQQFREHGIA
jgi:L-ribulose-5-phosphate 3-epimerase